ncbi:DNA cytosine methyltransferase [Neobacillus pocheonensis]|uniref:DNA cytosine methyltransferase n=1 Tax=Neobacillus pocheonensis TaxID=363869 RepID=UPI003D285A9A
MVKRTEKRVGKRPLKVLYSGEIVVDNFAGGGGASTGIEMAIGRAVDVAINHDLEAIAMHKANHPETVHYCESVWDKKPIDITKGRSVALCWFSPDCKHFSKAKGGKPKEKHIRGLAWVSVRWAATVKPRVIILENVEEFMDWGPLLEDGKPDPEKKGHTFHSFINALKAHGYTVEWRILKACDYGAPTSRKRFFLIARCDDQPIVWPKPTHGAPNSIAVQTGKLLPYRTAAEIIDFSRPCPSIFGRRKELSANTKRRIARGIQRFVINNANPFIIKVNHSGENFRGQEIDKPLQTITAKNGWGIVTPYIARIGQTGFAADRLQYSVEQPLTTITTKTEHCLVTPTLIQIGYGEAPGQEPRALDLHKPLGTITAGGNKFGVAEAVLAPANERKADRSRATLAASHIIKFKGTNVGQAVTDPLQTITAVNHFGEVRTFLEEYCAESGNDTENLGYVTIDGQLYQIVDIGFRMLEPYELFAAQGFPPDYIIDRVDGGKPYPKSEQVARCGNSVSPVIPNALVRANLPELCAEVDPDSTSAAWKTNGQYELALSI